MKTKTGSFKKILHVGETGAGYPVRKCDVFVKVEFTDDGRLSMTGVVGPRANGDSWGSCGQIHDELLKLEWRPDGWTAGMVSRLYDIWKLWHLNDMRAGCEHQRAAGWDKRPIDPKKPTSTYGRHFDGQKQDSWNLLGWVRRDEHPKGLMCEPCPECGYKYGSAWLKEEVPFAVLEWLRDLPDTDKTPAWV